LVAVLGALLMGPGVGANDLPTGERLVGASGNSQSEVEPAYDDATGSLVYVNVPLKAQVSPHAPTAPFYLIEYPTSVASIIGTVNCQHEPAENCPDHGGFFASEAIAHEPGVYSAGNVWGHDHILAAPPAPPPSGGDFNIIWEPIGVYFTNAVAAQTHITTLAQLNDALQKGDVIEVAYPQANFHCSIVGAGTYDHATPVPSIAPIP
jgi:hypothetical protein